MPGWQLSARVTPTGVRRLQAHWAVRSTEGLSFYEQEVIMNGYDNHTVSHDSYLAIQPNINITMNLEG